LKIVVRQLPDLTDILKGIVDNTSAYEGLNRFAIDGLIRAVSGLGLFAALSEPQRIGPLREDLGVIDKYERLFNAVIEVLNNTGYVEQKDGMFALKYDIQLIQEQIRQVDLDEQARDLVKSQPDLQAHIRLVKPCLEALPEIFTGKVSAKDFISSGSSADLVEGFYKGNPALNYFNERVADVIETYVQHRIRDLKETEKICILEIGAGACETSAMIFERLKGYAKHLDYVYTDISKNFLMHAEEHYCKENPYIRMKLFDFEKPLVEQDIQENFFDLVVTSNVLHATRNMMDTLEQVKVVLKTNGLLVLNEKSAEMNFLTPTFSLLGGWWLCRMKRLI